MTAFPGHVHARAPLATDSTPAPSPAPSPSPSPAPAPSPPGSESEQASPPQRVVVRPSRTQEVGGTVEFEDDEAIVIRTPEGRLESFAKGRLFQLIRLIDPQPGQTGTVLLRDGTRQHGVILEDALEHVRLDIAGVRVTFPRADVHGITLDTPFEERYERLRRTMDTSTPDQQFQLAQWLRAERRFDLAIRELRELLSRFDHEPSRRLLALVETEFALQQERDRRRDDERERPPPRERGEPAPGPRVLTDEEVNILRVYELDFRHPPRLMVPRPVIQRLITEYASHPLMPATEVERNRLFREDPLQLVRLIFELRARELYPEIRILTEPYAFNLFRQRVHDAWLIPNCATSQCHGGEDAGRLWLIGRNFRDLRVRSTNFLILNRVTLDDPEWPLLNFQQPLDSLVLQYALPRSVARMPHPDVPGFTPAIPRASDDRVRDFVAFMQALHPRRVDYPIDFQPPPTPGWVRRMAEREAARLDDPDDGRIDR